jgi:hypothetical protein
MKKDQQNPNDKTLLGLKKRNPSNKPKEERIMKTVNRMIHRIQNGERKCICRDTTTRHACDYPSFSRTRYRINKSDFMRRAIVRFVQNIEENPEQDNRYMVGRSFRYHSVCKW